MPTAIQQDEVAKRLVDLDARYYALRRNRDPQSSYAAGRTDRNNPIPRGIDPLGTDADYHYSTAREYYLMVERGREAVRNHPLVGQGINRLIANLRMGDCTLDVNSGDERIDSDLKEDWKDWCEDRRACDYEETLTFQQKARQSFFSQVQDGDVLHVPLATGQLQDFEAHQLRTPYGHRPTGNGKNGIIHGVEVWSGVKVAYHVTPFSLSPFQNLTRRFQSTRLDAFDVNGNPTAFWLGFTSRFGQRRGVSRLAAPREAMNGFDDLNYAHIKSSLRRALISFLMKSNGQPMPFVGGGGLPQAGGRTTATSQTGDGLGISTQVIEQMGEPALALKAPDGYGIEGWNADMPGGNFFEHAALMLTMLAVNLDIPLSFLLLDGSLVNFHGARSTFDQVKLRLQQMQRDQIQGLYTPTYQWRVRMKLTPGTPFYDPILAAAVARGVNPFKHSFRPKGWPYVKPAEDVAAESKAEKDNLRSMRAIYADRGLDFDEEFPVIIRDRGRAAGWAITEAIRLRDEFPDAEINVPQFFRELLYGPAGQPSQTDYFQDTEERAAELAAAMESK